MAFGKSGGYIGRRPGHGAGRLVANRTRRTSRRCRFRRNIEEPTIAVYASKAVRPVRSVRARDVALWNRTTPQRASHVRQNPSAGPRCPDHVRGRPV
jgi:hypothetical protein